MRLDWTQPIVISTLSYKGNITLNSWSLFSIKILWWWQLLGVYLSSFCQCELKTKTSWLKDSTHELVVSSSHESACLHAILSSCIFIGPSPWMGWCFSSYQTLCLCAWHICLRRRVLVHLRLKVSLGSSWCFNLCNFNHGGF